MYLGVISDTHGIIPGTEAAIKIFRERNVRRVIHCGDIGSAAVVELFRGWTVDFVFGNCDIARRSISEKIEEIGGTLHDDFGSVEMEGKRIAFLHGQDEERLEAEARSQNWDLICVGHTHRRSYEQIKDARILNPGSIQRRFDMPSVAIVELPKIDVCYFNVK